MTQGIKFEGRVIADVEKPTFTSKGKPQTSFKLPLNFKKEAWGSHEAEEATIWCRVKVFGDAAEYAATLKKGDIVTGEGFISFPSIYKESIQLDIVAQKVEKKEVKSSDKPTHKPQAEMVYPEGMNQAEFSQAHKKVVDMGKSRHALDFFSESEGRIKYWDEYESSYSDFAF